MAARGEPGECGGGAAESKRTIPSLCTRFTLGVVRASPSPTNTKTRRHACVGATAVIPVAGFTHARPLCWFGRYLRSHNQISANL